MSNVVFVLGAGASKQAGAPLMGNFLDVATDLLRSNRVDDKRIHFDRVFSAIGGLQAVHSKAQLDLNNIESIFTALELGRIIQRVPGMDTDSIPEVIASLTGCGKTFFSLFRSVDFDVWNNLQLVRKSHLLRSGQANSPC